MRTTLSDHHAAWHRTFGRYTTCPMDCGSNEGVERVFENDAQTLRKGAHGIRCGSCGGRHAMVDTVRFCHKVRWDAETFARNDAAMVSELESAGECEHGMSAALCSGPNHW